MTSRNHWAVNWVDGMKINKTHFKEQEAYWREQAALLAESTLTDYTYGLLPPTRTSPSLELVVTPELVEVRSCRAITRGGLLLVIGTENNAELQKRMSDLMYGRDFSDADTWLVVVRVHPNERLEIGTPNPDESPLRHPNTSMRYTLEIVPANHLNEPDAYHHALPLARILRGFQGIERDRDFIPPVSQIRASDQLVQAHQRWKESLLTMEGDTFEIIKKIKDKHRNNQGNQLSADLLHLTQAVIRFVNEHFDPYRLALPNQAPFELFLWFMSLARLIKNEVRLAGNSENMLQYMAHFIEGVKATDLMSFCNELCDQEYNHTAIRPVVDRVDNFLGFITRLFAQLRQLDYHQIANPTIIDSRMIGRRGGGSSIISRPTSPPSGGSSGSIRVKARRNDAAPRRDDASPPPTANPEKGGWDLE